ncbi:(2Fe-2S)-binding protein [Brevibacillus marinus]|uniref:(2Fe-2S)-binding protein n=1 Tax=Brevibacillus marinus TaxID=2496837 RepID=UPI001F49F644|nr:(2Fe-2S)-binding protein [Brevibacillus marinus]
MSSGYRIRSFAAERGERQVTFFFNGTELRGYEGEPIAAALLANGIRTIRTCEITAQPRGIFCGIGHCYECRAEVDGIANVRTCLTPLRQGSRVVSTPSWEQRRNEHER